MKRFLLTIVFLLFLTACAEEFPPSPPPPGGQTAVGRAVGGIPISPSSLPSWAAPLKYTDITPTTAKVGDTITVTVDKPVSVRTTFFVYAVAYAYNKKFKIWEKVFADTSKSGKIAKDWAKDRAVFSFPVSSERFIAGPNYVVIYTCIDTGERDSKGYKIWDCEKWKLGAWELLGQHWPDILIEKDIENNRYQLSTKEDIADGAAYTASYEDLNKIKTTATVLQLKDLDGYKKKLTDNIIALEPQWTKRGNVCGFLKSATGQVSFSWLSGTNWITVINFASTPSDEKIGVYGIKYPSDCDLLNKLKGVAAPVCGNGKTEAGEHCDKSDDANCPGACKPDCSCALMGTANFGFCGDSVIEVPNAQGVHEQCEPPGKRDPVTAQLTSTSCFTRDSTGAITGVGACNEQCLCVQTPFTPAKCGDGKIDAGEQCGEPGAPGCKANEACTNCACRPIPANCPNGKLDPGEQCDYGNPGVACPAGQACMANCVCAQLPKGGCSVPPDQCVNAAQCPQLPGLAVGCLGCHCFYVLPPWPWWSFCGNGVKEFGEECEGDIDCANPPGGIVSPTCNKATCKCNKVCGDGKVDAPNNDAPPINEECDPPGAIAPGCPPIQLPGGGCGFPVCLQGCKCPAGQPCQGGCGNGIVEAPNENCEKPGDPCGCWLGAGGAAGCFTCSGTCQCDTTKPYDKCPGKDCSKPGDNMGISLVVNQGTTSSSAIAWEFYGLGKHYTSFDTSTTQCWDICVSQVLLGPVAGSDGECYQTTARTSSIIMVGTTPQTSQGAQITEYATYCVDQSTVQKYLVSNTGCQQVPKTCSQLYRCQQVTSPPSAACVPSTPPPTSSPRPLSDFNTAASTSESTGYIVINSDINSRSMQIALIIIASLGILVVTLLNFTHHDE